MIGIRWRKFERELRRRVRRKLRGSKARWREYRRRNNLRQRVMRWFSWPIGVIVYAGLAVSPLLPVTRRIGRSLVWGSAQSCGIDVDGHRTGTLGEPCEPTARRTVPRDVVAISVKRSHGVSNCAGPIPKGFTGPRNLLLSRVMVFGHLAAWEVGLERGRLGRRGDSLAVRGEHGAQSGGSPTVPEGEAGACGCASLPGGIHLWVCR